MILVYSTPGEKNHATQLPWRLKPIKGNRFVKSFDKPFWGREEEESKLTYLCKITTPSPS
jgi:hypothetical protein